MSDPPRLRDLSHGVSDFERALLRSADPTAPLTAADSARLAAKLTPKLAAAGTVGSASVPLAAKALAAVALVSAVGFGIARTRAPETRPAPALHSAPELRAARTVAPTEPTRAPTEPTRAPTEPTREIAPAPPPTRPHHTVAAAAPVRPIAPVAPVAPARAPLTLAEESALVRTAHASLDGDPARAIALLTAARRDTPDGQLRDERDAVLAEAYARADRWNDARAIARELEHRAPGSAQTARVRDLLRNAP